MIMDHHPARRPAATFELRPDPLSPGGDDLPVGKALRLLRERENVSQTDLERLGGPDHRTISHWETGRKMPSLRLLIQYLNAAGLDLHDLQDAFDEIAERPDRLTHRVTEIERRLGDLEHVLRAVCSHMRGEICEQSTTISTAS